MFEWAVNSNLLEKLHCSVYVALDVFWVEYCFDAQQYPRIVITQNHADKALRCYRWIVQLYGTLLCLSGKIVGQSQHRLNEAVVENCVTNLGKRLASPMTRRSSPIASEVITTINNG